MDAASAAESKPSGAPDDVRITVLGAFGVGRGPCVVDEAAWSRRRPMELVQLLAITPGHQLVRDQVVDALWPHLDLDAGAANLRKAAHHARRCLGDPGAVVLRGGQVRLFPDRRVTTDLERFDQLAAEALARHDRATAARALDCYAGDLLPGSPYEDWTHGPRRHAQQRRIALWRMLGAWSHVVAAEPTDEEAYQALMRSALDRGLRSEVIRWYDQARVVLATELGTSPAPETDALYRAAVDGLAAAGVALVGRGPELARATRILRDAEPRRVVTLVVRGEAGIGKTAFCREVARVARSEGTEVHWAESTGTTQPYGPLIGLIEEVLLASRAALAAVERHVHAVLASLTPSARPAPETSGPVSRHQVIGATCHLLRACSGGRSSVIVLDDAHEADAATLDVLFHVASSVPDFSVVMAHRHHRANATLERGVARLERSGRLVTVDLGPLTAEDASEIARRAARDGRRDGALDDDAVAEVVRLGGGNPFVLGELARHAGIAGTGVAPGVREAIAARFVDLDADAVALLQRVAVAADELDPATVVEVMGGPEGRAYEVLDRALDAGALVVSGSRYRFRHELIRQALVDGVPPHHRVAIHREVATRLSRVGAPAAVVARHWCAANDLGAASGWLVRAGEEALAVGAFVDARQLVGEALRHEPAHPAALRIEAEALDMLGDPGALAAYDAAIAVAGEDEVGDLVAMRALAQVKQGDPHGGLANVARAVPRSVKGKLSEALTYAGAAALGAASPAVGTAKAAECRRLALESGDRAAIVIASWAQAAAAHARGDLRESVLADLRDTRDLPHLAVRVFDGHLCITQRFLYGARPYDDVIAFADGLGAEARRLGAARGVAFGATLRGEAELLAGQLARAEVDLIAAVGLHRATGGPTGEAHALQRLAEVALGTDRPERARALIDEALDLARVTDIGFHLLDRIYGTRIAMATDPGEALAAVDEAEDAVRGQLETCPGCRITFAVPAAIACARAGEVERAGGYGRVSEYLAHVVMRLPAWDAAYEEVLGHLARAAGDRAEGARRFARASSGFGAAGHPLDRRRCEVLAAAP